MEQFNERDLHKPIGFTFDVPRNGDTVKTGEIEKKLEQLGEMNQSRSTMVIFIFSDELDRGSYIVT